MAAEIHGCAYVDPAPAKQAAQFCLDVREPEEAGALLGPELD
jgi:hypothetical protein